MYPVYAARSIIGALMWLCDDDRLLSAIHTNTASVAQSTMAQLAWTATPSGENSPRRTCSVDAARTYDQKPIRGMYRSGALMSFLGGLNVKPPATCSGILAHDPL